MARFSLVPAAYVALLRDGRVLLQQRKDTGYMDGHWSFSAAGHVERGESVHAAALREAYEELGVSVNEADLDPICTVHRRQNERGGGQRVDFFFAARTWEGEPTARDLDRIGEICWADLTALPEPLVPVDAIVLEMLRTGQRTPIVHWGF
jgi:8-oxo-dGTP pyrophosphatase MutT (NUDIX family)